jgi:hypothetical protein
MTSSMALNLMHQRIDFGVKNALKLTYVSFTFFPGVILRTPLKRGREGREREGREREGGERECRKGTRVK